MSLPYLVLGHDGLSMVGSVVVAILAGAAVLLVRRRSAVLIDPSGDVCWRTGCVPASQVQYVEVCTQSRHQFGSMRAGLRSTTLPLYDVWLGGESFRVRLLHRSADPYLAKRVSEQVAAVLNLPIVPSADRIR